MAKNTHTIQTIKFKISSQININSYTIFFHNSFQKLIISDHQFSSTTKQNPYRIEQIKSREEKLIVQSPNGDKIVDKREKG